MTTETKHDGYAVFTPDGTMVVRTVNDTISEARAEWSGHALWPNYEGQGYTVRPVTITEVKDDE